MEDKILKQLRGIMISKDGDVGQRAYNLLINIIDNGLDKEGITYYSTFIKENK